MPERTINDVVFQFRNEKGVLVDARRGETVDIPEGEDLDRGDKYGAFTDVAGDEPKPPEGTKMPAIEVGWSDEELKHWVDAAHSDEITAGVQELPAANRGDVARRIIQAENGRGNRVRKKVINSLAQYDTKGSTTTE